MNITIAKSFAPVRWDTLLGKCKIPSFLMGTPNELGRPGNVEVIATTSGEELIFSDANVEKMRRVLGPITIDSRDEETRVVTFDFARLEFGGDRGIAPDFKQRTSIHYSTKNGNVNLRNIDRVEHDSDNPDALRFVAETDTHIASLTVNRGGAAAYTTRIK